MRAAGVIASLFVQSNQPFIYNEHLKIMNMENQKLNELHKKVGDYIYNLESACFEQKKEFVKPGIKSESQKLIESSREGIHRLIDEAFNSEQ